MDGSRLRHVWLILAFATLPALGAGENFVANGSFDNDLKDWTYRYDWKGQGHYSGNHQLVEVLDKFGGRSKVLRLNCRPQGVADNQGVKVDSKAIPFNPDYEHTLHVVARSNGPGVRILVEGHRWLPGLPPEGHPELRDLRKFYKFKTVPFRKKGLTGGVATIGDRWTQGRMKIPSTPIDKMSSLSMKNFKKVQFLVVHIVAIAGSAGDVYLDDVKLVRGRKLPRLPSTSK